jgi:hypothetical protein
MIKDLIRIDGDLLIERGDVVLGDSTYQHFEELLLTEKGWLKFAPLRGVGLRRYINDEVLDSEFRQIVRKELEADGALIISIAFDENDKINIVGEYGLASELGSTNNGNSEEIADYIVKENQSIFDVAVIVYGNVLAAFRVMELNGITEISEEIREGQKLKVDKTKLLNIVRLYNLSINDLATKTPNNNRGIGFDIVGLNNTIG